MGLIYRLEDYARYKDAVGEATYVDISRRTDPARIPVVWDRLSDIHSHYGAPWVVQAWTKDPAGVAKLGKSVMQRLVGGGTTITAQISVTGMAGSIYEPNVPTEVDAGVDALAGLVGGPEHLCWRYDPILLQTHNMDRFAALARRMASHGIRRGVINFCLPGQYKRVDRRMLAIHPDWGVEGVPTLTQRIRIASDVVRAASNEGISLACCAESTGLADQVPGLGRAACGDYAWFSALSGVRPEVRPYRGSRKGCGCLHYFDVGSYGMRSQCFGCLYCYAG